MSYEDEFDEDTLELDEDYDWDDDKDYNTLDISEDDWEDYDDDTTIEKKD